MRYMYAVYREGSREIMHMFNTEYEARAYIAFMPFKCTIVEIKA